MYNKIITILLVSLCLLFISGCTVNSNRVYTICKIDESDEYCYSDNGEFFKVVDGYPIKISSVGLKSLPALTLSPTEGEYKFVKQMPGLYKGTLRSVNCYIFKICNGDTSNLEVKYRDWNNIEVYVYTDDYNARVIFNIRGDVRIYFINSKQEPIEPLYI